MSNSIVAKRYAVALFEIAKEKNALDTMTEEIRAVKEVFSTNQELYAFLKQPKITLQQKQQLLSDAFTGISDDIKSTIMLMIERHRTDEIAQMSAEFVELCIGRAVNNRPLSFVKSVILFGKVRSKFFKNRFFFFKKADLFCALP